MGFYRLSESCQIERLGEIYESFFGQATDGTFVEVGAFDGEQMSNTSGLADIGWAGLYIEPVTVFAIDCRVRHRDNPRVMVVSCAIGDQPGPATIHVAHAFSTMHEDELAMSKASFRQMFGDSNRGGLEIDRVFTGETEIVPVERLDTILTQYALKPRFELLVVDVDGHETEVFNSFDLDAWRPRMLIVELTDDHPDYTATHEKIGALRARIVASGYAPIHRDAWNTIFVDQLDTR